MHHVPRPAQRTSRRIAQWMVGLRTLLARRPWIYWLFVVGVAGLISVSVSRALAEVRHQRNSWGETTTVYVAVAPISPGDLVAPLVETRTVPIALSPTSAVDIVGDGSTARQRIAVGEIVVAVDIGPASGPLALLPSGWLALSVQEAMPTLFTVGDHAVVLAAGSTVAAEALVIDVLADAVVIGVPADAAPAVAEVVAQRLAVIALSGG